VNVRCNKKGLRFSPAGDLLAEFFDFFRENEIAEQDTSIPPFRIV